MYIYTNHKSKLNGQQYSYHTIDGRVYLTPIKGSTQTQIRMPFTTFWKAVKDGYYTNEQNLLDELDKYVTNSSILGYSIKNAIKRKRPTIDIIRMIKSQAEDNEVIAMDIVGESLLKRIQCIRS